MKFQKQIPTEAFTKVKKARSIPEYQPQLSERDTCMLIEVLFNLIF